MFRIGLVEKITSIRYGLALVSKEIHRAQIVKTLNYGVYAALYTASFLG